MQSFMEKATDFGVDMVNLQKYLSRECHEYTISDQIKRSGTAIGASYGESRFAESDADFVHKLRIALKEANETKYWLDILKRTDYIQQDQYDKFKGDLSELIKILVSSINTTLKRMKRDKKNDDELNDIF